MGEHLSVDALLARHRAEAAADVITLLGKRLDQMSADQPSATDDWARAFDEGWNGARLQINDSILNPRIAEHVRAAAERGAS